MSKLLTLGVVQQGSLLNQSEAPDAAPTGLVLTVVDRTDIKLDWTDNATNEDGYKIERSLNGVDFTVIDTVAANTETYTDEDLSEDTKYYYRVRAYKGAEYSAYTDTEDETTGSTAFKITVDTTKAGSANDTFVLPTTGAGFDAYVDWGDGGVSEHITATPGNVTHVYASSGTYQIAITGTFPGIGFSSGGDKLKVISIDNWGDIAWSTMVQAFYGCSNLIECTGKNPNFSAVASFYLAFRDCKFSSLDVSDWDTSSSKSFNATFYACSNLKGDFSGLDIGFATNISNMFVSCDINETGTTTNYDNTLIGWAAQTVNSGLSPNFGSSKYGQGKVDEGTTDGTTTDKLVDSSQNFLTTVTVGDVIHNTTDGTYARVTAIDSDTTLSLDNDIMVSGEAYVIQHSDAAKARASLILDDGWTISDGFAL